MYVSCRTTTASQEKLQGNKDDSPATQTQRKSNTGLKKRSLDVPDMLLLPYHGKPKVTVFHYKKTDVFSLQDNFSLPRKLDLIWMMNHAIGSEVSEEVPMWIGFNAMINRDELPRQKVSYMPNLKEPITSLFCHI